MSDELATSVPLLPDIDTGRELEAGDAWLRTLPYGRRAPARSAASADRWSGQTDEAELGFTYHEADHVLHVTGCADAFTEEVAARCRVDRAVAERVLARVRASTFERADKPRFPRTAPL